MLNPRSRRHLFDVLQPPAGYLLDQAIGTTYTLDLTALLTVPLAFTFFGESDFFDIDSLRDEDDGAQQKKQHLPDTMALLDGVRRYADRISIFCQAGHIAVPRASQLLYSYLEDSVCEVTPVAADGVFHPKVWVLRYRPDGNGNDVRYRLLVSSRNLTFDRSWDTLLSLDGRLTDRERAVNQPLAHFVGALLRLAVRPTVLEKTVERVALFQDELPRVEFDIPGPYTEINFYPLGLDGSRHWPFNKGAVRRLVVSPFLAPRFLQRFTHGSSSNTLVTRLESADSLSLADLEPFDELYVLDPDADLEADDADGAQNQDELETTDRERVPPLFGLHAKLFIEEDDRNAFVWTGSANATNAAMSQNVEFMVRLRGAPRDVGAASLLGDGSRKDASFAALLKPYQPTDTPLTQDETQRRLEEHAHRVRKALTQAQLVATVEEGADGYQVRLRSTQTVSTMPDTIQSLRCWPITQKEMMGLDIDAALPLAATFEPLSLEGLTSFFAFSLTLREAQQSYKTQFVLRLPLRNVPEGRLEHIVRRLLANRDRVLRYLLFLLADDADTYSFFEALFRSRSGKQGESAALPLPANLFESLVRVLATDPGRLDEIDRLLADLPESEVEELLPPGFNTIWEPAWQARLQLKPEEKPS
jgi:hypothetical protein